MKKVVGNVFLGKYSDILHLKQYSTFTALLNLYYLVPLYTSILLSLFIFFKIVDDFRNLRLFRHLIGVMSREKDK